MPNLVAIARIVNARQKSVCLHMAEGPRVSCASTASCDQQPVMRYYMQLQHNPLYYCHAHHIMPLNSFKATLVFDETDPAILIDTGTAGRVLYPCAVDSFKPFFVDIPAQRAEDATLRDAAEALIHLWYSAFLPNEVLLGFKSRVEPLLAEVCSNIQSTSPETVIKKNLEFQFRKYVCVALTKQQWSQSADILWSCSALTQQEAENLRAATVLAPERTDYRDRWYFKDANLFSRIAKQRFREDGLLLPSDTHVLASQTLIRKSTCGAHRPLFQLSPLRLLFRNTETWLMDDKRDPLDGWSPWEVDRWTTSAKEDSYGKLFAYLRAKFESFLKRLLNGSFTFEMHCRDVMDLPNHLEKARYARIEPFAAVTNHKPVRNTDKTLFLNAVMETVRMRGDEGKVLNTQLMKYLPTIEIASLTQPNNAEMLRLWDARSLDPSYMALFNFRNISAASNGAMKTKNSIVEAWPFQLKLRYGTAGSQHEFDTILASNLSGLEHYVEMAKGTVMRLKQRPNQGVSRVHL
ncbi:hypothetical protein MRB53_038486 [Persea americana]|nr:hypothetical protein MRB53_038486 [Persea americana]